MPPRTEKDLLGSMDIPADVLWGIHTARATQNFTIARRPVHPELVAGYGLVKHAAAEVNHELGYLEDNIYNALRRACAEMVRGDLTEHIIVDALQGGAGTSTNMNVNEVLANRALQLLDHPPGRYDVISPLGHVNLHQSTNDTYPTALKVAAIRLLRELEREVVSLMEAFQQKEKQFADVVKVGRTQMQDAVLITLGREMSTYAEALGRDRWRIYKCEERLRVVNLGGTAIGTGIDAPRQYIFRVVDALRELTGIGLARAENLVEATGNTDVFVEVSGILKAHATNLLKCATDLRMLSSGPAAGLGEITLPAVQPGSSIMPGKVNPVIPEAVSQAAMQVMAGDQAIAHAASMGNLELNPFLPLVADALLNNISMLTEACRTFRVKCVEGIEVNRKKCADGVETTTAAATALVGKLGYDVVQSIMEEAQSNNTSIKSIIIEKGFLTEDQYNDLISPESVTRLGFKDNNNQ